jgi:hypothetical protein
MKKRWITPQLVSLVRGTPEEAVLQNCKDGSNGTGPSVSANACGITTEFACLGCQNVAAS